jgi:hexosaminidase
MFTYTISSATKARPSFAIASIAVATIYCQSAVLACGSEVKRNSPIAFHIRWQVVKNSLDVSTGGMRFEATLTLENNSSQPLEASGWRLYMSSPRLLQTDSTVTHLRFTHINGDFYQLAPDSGFRTIEPGASRIIQVKGDGPVIKACELPSGHYFVFSDPQGNDLPPVEVTHVDIDEFTTFEQTLRHPQDNVSVSTAQSVFMENAELTKVPYSEVSLVIPSPASLSRLPGGLKLAPEAIIAFDPGLEREADYLATQLGMLFGCKIASVQSGNTDATIQLRLNASLKTAAHVDSQSTPDTNEAYSLAITPERAVHVTGRGAAGVFYGIQSLLSLLPPQAFSEQQESILLRAVNIEDAPRFPYRGLLVDVARNFQTKTAIKKLLDLMAHYKLNRFHFHLSDDEGWRLAIAKLPELTTVGGRRGHTLDERDWLIPSQGSGPRPDGPSGSGFYSREDFIEILQYAADRHIEVIPEFDFPGHARAAIRSMESRRLRLIEDGSIAAAGQYALRDPHDQSAYTSAQMWRDNVVDVGMDSTYRFLSVVIDEVVSIYAEAGVPLRCLHIGGDEVPSGAWQASEACQRLVDSGQVDSLEPTDLQSFFLKKVFQLAAKHNVRIAGWEELLLAHTASKAKQPNIDLLASQRPVIGYVWNNVWGWGQEDYAYRLANAGFEIVLCNATNLYFDLAHEKHPLDRGHRWAGLVDTKQPFEFAPLNYFANAKHDILGRPFKQDHFADAVRLSESGRSKILGIQGQLWSEYLRSQERLEYMAFPRIIALAERAWSKQPAWEELERTDERQALLDDAWDSFANSLGQQQLPKLDFLFGGTDYRLPPPGAKIEQGVLYANVAFPGLEVRFASDGSEPTAESPRYQGPIAVTGPVVLRTFDRRGRGSRVVDCSATTTSPRQ